MRKKMPPSMRILQDNQPDQGMLLLHEAICCQGNAAPEPAGELQTCGICQRHFALADVIRFIHQRVLPGSPGGAGGPPEAGRDTPPVDRPSDLAGLALNGRRRPSGSAPRRLPTSVGDRKKLQLNGLSPTPSVSSTSSREEESRKEREEEVRRRLVDTGANTTDSEPGSYVCFTCKNSFDSAWSLVRHVQEDHGVNIYENRAAATCRPSTPSPPLRRRSPSPRRRSPSPRLSLPSPRRNSPSPHRSLPSPRRVLPPPRQLSPPRLAPEPAPLPPVARPPPPPPMPPVSARLAPTSCHASFELPFLRMPLGGDKPFPSMLGAPFSRPPSHNFRMENIISEQFRMSSSEQFRMNAPLSMPPFELGQRPRPPLSLPMEPLDFYSQRLRQLAGASLPVASDLLSPPAKRLRVSPPPPFGSPAGPSTSSPSPVQQPAAPARPAPPKRKERPRACEHCHKIFRFQSNLIVHRRIHTGEKPYKCKICSHACTQSSKLKRHMKTHMKELELSVEKNSQASDDAKDEDDDVSVQEEDEEELLDEDDEDSSVAAEADGPEDLSTKSAASTPVPAPLTPNNNLPPTPSSEKSSLVGELMDKFGLSNINAYRDAYKQALRESGKDEEPLSDSNHSDDELLDSETHDSEAHDSEARDSDGQDSDVPDSDALDSEAPGSEAQESNDGQAGERHSSEARDGEARFGETRDSEARESSARDGEARPSEARAGEARDFSRETSGGDRMEWSTIKVREEFGGGLLSHQPVLDLSRGSLLGLEAAFDPSHRLKLDLGGREPPDPSLFPALWLPPMAMSRDFPFPPRSAPDFLSHAKAASEGAFKAAQRPHHNPFAPKPGGRIGLHSPSPKRERSRRDTCEYCGKVFKNCSNLTVHRRSHTGEKPYQCNMCNYACAQSSKLTRHMKTHGRMGKDVYQCRFCTMPFSVASTLEKHMRKCVVSQNNKTGLLPPVLPGH